MTVVGLTLAFVAGCGVDRADVDLSSVAPCALLDQAQLAEVGLAGASAQPGTAGVTVRTCRFTAPPSSLVVLMVDPKGRLDGIQKVMAGTSPELGALEEGEVGGRPSLHSTGKACNVFVDLGSGVLGVSGGPDCGAIQRTAELAVTSLSA
jgi:hypothetical protein